MNKVFQYKCYKVLSETVYNRIWQGDFEGDYPYNHTYMWTRYWSALGSPTQAVRYRRDSFTGKTSQYGLQMAGTQRMVVPTSIGLFNGGVNPQVIAIMSVWSKTDWSSTSTRQDLFNSGLATSNKGYGIVLNYTAGYISAVAANGTTTYEAKVLLTSLAAGSHEIGMKFDGTNLKLYIDGVAVATTAVSGNLSYNGGIPIYIGADDSVSSPTRFVTNGSVHHIAVYGTSTTADLPTDTDFTRYTENWHAPQSTLKNTVTLLYNFSDLAANVVATNDSILSYTASLKIAAVTVTNVMNVGSCVRIQTAVAGSSNQGIALTLNRPAVTVGQTYSASAWVKGTAGEVATLAIIPIGAGSTVTKAITLTGSWQRVAAAITTVTGATNVELDIYLTNATASVKNLYIDGIMLEDGTKLHNYFNDFTPDAKPAAYYYADITNKRHVAKLRGYDYVTTWADVSSDYQLEYEINTAGGQVTVDLARTYENIGEGVDVKKNNRIEVSVISNDFPNGKVVFIGKILDYKKIVGAQESVEVTLLGYGENTDRTMIEDGETPVFSNTDTAGNYYSAGFALALYVGQSFTTEPDQTNISRISFYAKAGSTSVWNGVGDIHDPASYTTYDYSNETQLIQVWEDLTQASGNGSGYPPAGGGIPIASSYLTGPPSSTVPDWWTWQLKDLAGNPSPLEVNPSQRYYITVTPQEYNGASGASIMIDSSAANARSGDVIFYTDSGLQQDSAHTLTMKVYQSYGATRVTYSTLDPSEILRRIIKDYNRQGGQLTYDSSSIENTGTVVSYPFNTNTVFEGFKKCLEMAPANWYFYIDQATNKVHFHPKSSATIHTLTLGIEFEKSEFETRVESVINKIYLTGGPDPVTPTQNLFRVYKNQTSIDNNDGEVRAISYSDGRVIDTTTMDIMAHALLDEYPNPEIRTTLNLLAGGNIVIENVKPGDMFKFAGFPGGPPAPNLQLARYEYSPDRIGGTLSSTPPDVNKRIEDIKRNLDTQVVSANPSIATEAS
jgi:hypothetical protein